MSTLRPFRCTACGEYALSTGELGGEAHVRSSPVLEVAALASLCEGLPDDLYRMGAAGAVVVQGAALCGDGRGRWIEVGAKGKEHDDELCGPVTDEARAAGVEARARTMTYAARVERDEALHLISAHVAEGCGWLIKTKCHPTEWRSAERMAPVEWYADSAGRLIDPCPGCAHAVGVDLAVALGFATAKGNTHAKTPDVTAEEARLAKLARIGDWPAATIQRGATPIHLIGEAKAHGDLWPSFCGAAFFRGPSFRRLRDEIADLGPGSVCEGCLLGTP